LRKHYRVFEKGKGIGGEFIKIHEKLGRRQKAINKPPNSDKIMAFEKDNGESEKGIIFVMTSGPRL